ncbi:MAG TPA: hypothetical protein DCM38_02630 [Gammaproteobacteria bacterium]|nr:hypothetical protein [Gammaproteobacteria bacterium]
MMLNWLNRFKKSTVFCFLIAGLSLASSFVYAEEHPIDIKTQTCLDNNYQTNEKMKGCSLQAYEDWDAELNKVYKALKKSELDAKVKKQIKQAQRKWLKYRNTEFKAIDAIYDAEKRGGGTMWGLLAADAKVEIVKNRVLVLSGYLQDSQAALK